MLDPSEIHLLWEHLPHPPGSIVRWFARTSEQKVGDYATNPDYLVRMATMHAGYNFYVMPNPTSQRAGARVTSDDISHWSYLLIDIDPVEKDARPIEALMFILERLRRDTCRNIDPMIIDSGRGAQAWIRLEDVPLIDDPEYAEKLRFAQPVTGEWYPDGAHRKLARKVSGWWLRRLAEALPPEYGCKVDTSTSDLPRVMRCPGTVNQKTGRTARILGNGVLHRGLTSGLVNAVPESVYHEEEVKPLAPGVPWQLVLPTLTMRAKTFITEGWEEPGRHASAQHAAKTMFERGLARDEILKALRRGNALCRPEPIGDADILRMVDALYQ